MKKLITSLVFAIAAICAYAQSFQYEGINYNVLSASDKTCELASYNDVSGDITIPETVTYNNDQYTVTSIGEGAFINCSSLTEITLPEGLTSIGVGAFFGCRSLTEITLSEGLTSIGGWAFSDCTSLTSITLPEGLTSIGDSTFSGCARLTSITLPEGLTSIGNLAFSDCAGLTSINIPKRVTSIRTSAFSGCTSLTAINVASENQVYASIDGVLFSKDFTILIQCPAGKSGDYIVPEGVTSIGDWAFEWCKSLTSITVPEGLTSIGDCAFSRCQSLTYINVAEGNNYYASIDGVLFSKDLKTLITYPGGRGGEYSVPEGVTSIGGWAFAYCESLTSITLPEGLTSIGDAAFYKCAALTEITLPEGLTSIGNYAFCGCQSLISITLPEGIVSIEFAAFYECTSLASITLPESLTSIRDLAFNGCKSLSTVNSYATTPPVCDGEMVFYEIPSDATLHVPVGTKAVYAASTGWSVFNNIIDDLVVQSGIEEIKTETETIDTDDSVVVYNLQGHRVNVSRRSDLPSLPAGIYIVGDKKVLVK